MLRSQKNFEKCVIGATDGDIGQVKDLYFDDHDWVVRYLTVDTGSWLSSRKLLISPISIQEPDCAAHKLAAAITRDQVANSPEIDTDKPVSRQHEVQYLGYYGYPNYWGGAGMWGAGMIPVGMYSGYATLARRTPEREQVIADRTRAEHERHRNDDPNLRSCAAVIGHRGTEQRASGQLNNLSSTSPGPVPALCREVRILENLDTEVLGSPAIQLVVRAHDHDLRGCGPVGHHHRARQDHR